MAVRIKRAYDKPGSGDGVRVLVDGLWPRGIKKHELKIEKWEKSIAPSKELRNWYGHEVEKWPEFRKRYRLELQQEPRKEALDGLVDLALQGDLTLVFGARDAEHSNAAVIMEMIQARAKDHKGKSAPGPRHSKKPG